MSWWISTKEWLPIVSRQCLICEKAENENADIINAGIVWVCPECKSKLRKIIEMSADKEVLE